MPHRNANYHDLTPEFQARFIALVRKGNFQRTVCAIMGVPRPTYYTWFNYATEPYVSFCAAVMKAAAEHEAEMLELMLEEPSMYKSVSFFLERRHPRNWRADALPDIDGPELEREATKIEVVVAPPKEPTK